MTTDEVLDVMRRHMTAQLADAHAALKGKCKLAVQKMEDAFAQRKEALDSVAPLKKQCADKQRQIDVLRADLKRKNDDLTTQRKAYDAELKEQGEKLRRLKDGPRYT